ncbi:MAG TPA: 23S rRNA (guanosine(2251)-2'-O)-methyltransferase RlmB [Chloroflexota bacterium]|nr:23S rRNA (guanosine(2251)-2'-O)-methyltransferase RlmB [Chloroflexota bacterium]
MRRAGGADGGAQAFPVAEVLLAAPPAGTGQHVAAEDVRWGTHAVEEALRAGQVRRLLLQEESGSGSRLAELAELAQQSGVPVAYVPAHALDTRAGTTRHQGAVAETRPFRYAQLRDLLATERDEPPFLLALDGVEDPQNLGAILRSADGAGVHGVVIPERRASGVTPAVARASAGAADYVAVAQVVNLARTLEELKGAGLWVYGLDSDGDVPYDAADYQRPLVIVAGAEGKGLSRLVRERCDALLSIPLHGHVASLNVSVATALAVFTARAARSRENS